MPSGVYKRTKKEIDFDKVLQLVLDGLTIENAIFSCGWKYSSTFYRDILKNKNNNYIEQKCYTLHTKDIS